MEWDKKSWVYGWEATIFLLYFLLYLGYLFWSLESEFVHWLTLVAVPFLIIYLIRRGQQSPLGDSLAAVGIEKNNWRTGLIWALLIGLGLSALQLAASNKAPALWDLILSGKAFYLLPLAFILLIFTAAFTEEFFFRGVIQTRLGDLFKNRIFAVVITSVLFGLYHLPYAYLNPRWPSYGNFGAALAASLGQGIVGGLILGTVFERSKRNLFASVLVHALINLLPAATMIKFSNG
ncbi:MAG: CPBP family intramembrane metalloprotease [Acidobacteriota bacterium]|nr:CPBP family intramembrane metalloprotease [Acidobacteriota bacterium]MDH3529380.1 CPBP family intramembrane metalloprotease [Acidobacteriota bacterium]